MPTITNDVCPVSECTHSHEAAYYIGGAEGRKHYWENHVREAHGLTIAIAAPDDVFSRASVTGDVGLEAILREIRKAPDPFVAAGEWLTKVTNAITEVAKEEPEPEVELHVSSGPTPIPLTDERRREIKGMLLEDMLREFRFSPPGRFQTGDPESDFFTQVFLDRKKATSSEVWAAISKHVDFPGSDHDLDLIAPKGSMCHAPNGTGYVCTNWVRHEGPHIARTYEGTEVARW